MIKVSNLGGSAAVATLISQLKDQQVNGATEIRLDLSRTADAYPNGLAPVAAVIDYFIRSGIPIHDTKVSNFVRRTRVCMPLRPTKENLARTTYHWNTVWQFRTSTEAYQLTAAVIRDLEEKVEFERGVLGALTWGLYEVLDNVLEHSMTKRGFFCMQYLRDSRRLVICVADAGIGIYRSFVEGAAGLNPASASEALELAIKKQTTSTADRRGNGLYGLAEIVRINGGTLQIKSGQGLLDLDSARTESILVPEHEQVSLDPEHQCTIVDFQLDVSRPVAIQDVFPREYDSRIENAENDEGEYVFLVKDDIDSIATRSGGRRMRKRLTNLLVDGAYPMTVDFSDVGVVSASFMDEFLGLTAAKLGPIAFHRAIRTRGLNTENRTLYAVVLRRRLEEVEKS